MYDHLAYACFGYAIAMATVLCWHWLAVREDKTRERDDEWAAFMQSLLDAEAANAAEAARIAARYQRKETNYGGHPPCQVCHGVGACAEADDGLNCAWRAYAAEYKR